MKFSKDRIEKLRENFHKRTYQITVSQIGQKHPLSHYSEIPGPRHHQPAKEY